MALEKEVMKEQAPEQEAPVDETSLSDEEEQDLTIAVRLAEDLIDDGGIEIVQQALQSSDPGQVIGQFLMQLVSQMSENLPKDIELSPRIYFAEGGWIEQVSDFLQDEYDIPRDVMDRAEMFIGTAAQQMAQGQASGQQQPPAGAPPAEAGAVMPQQTPMSGGA